VYSQVVSLFGTFLFISFRFFFLSDFSVSFENGSSNRDPKRKKRKKKKKKKERKESKN